MFAQARFESGPRTGLPGDPSLKSNLARFFAVNDAPVAVPDPSYSVGQGATLNVDAFHGVLANDADDDSPATSLRAVPYSGLTVSGGTVTLLADGSFTYHPASGFAGTDSFTYRANDGTFTYTNDAGSETTVAMSPDSNPVTVTITVLDSMPPIVTLGTPTPAPNAAG